jgi:hypothetical protein
MDFLVILFGAALLALIIASALGSMRNPKEKSFLCARCRQETDYTNRTIGAWRRGQKKFYCNACHQQWLRTHPPRETAERAGCLGVLAVPFLVIIALVANFA